MYKGKDKKTSNITKKGKKWYYYFYVFDSAVGKKKTKWSAGFNTKNEAISALEEVRALMKLGQYHAPSNQTVGEYITSWFQDIHKPNIRPSTARGYEVNIRVHIIPAIGHIRLGELTRFDVQRMCNAMLTNGSSPATTRYAYRVLACAIREAVLCDLIPKNVCDGVKLPKGSDFKALVLNKEQTAKFIDGAKHSVYGLEYILAITLGLRRGEVLGLRFSDFDLDKGTVHIQNQVTVVRSSKESPKGITEWGLSTLKTKESNRILYVAPDILDAIKSRQLQVKKDRLRNGASYNNMNLMSCNEFGEFSNPHTFYTHYKKLLAKLGLPSIRFHDLRHSYASIMIEEKIPLKVVSYTLGHSNISTTADIYCEVIQGHQEVAQKISDCFFNQKL